MKKYFTLIACFVSFYNTVKAQTITAVPIVTLTGAPGTPMMIAFNPIFNLYYASSGGGGCNQMTTYTSTGGAPISNTSVCYDARGTWWNPNTNVLEGNGYNGSGIYTVTLNGSGIPTNAGAFFPAGNIQPDPQSMGSYDPSTNNIIYYNSGNLIKRNRTTSALVATIPITGLPVGFGNLTTNCGFFTGIPGIEYAVYDYVNRRAYHINYNTGAYVSTVQFPPTAGAPSYYNLSYSNNMFFICNANVWQGYNICITASSSPSAICIGSSATLTAEGGNSYTWSPGGLNTASIVVNPTLTTNYTVAGVAQPGCPSTVTLTLNVNSIPTIAVNSGTICTGQSFTMNPSGANTYTYEGGNAVVSPTTNTNYTVVGTSSAGCISNVVTSSVTVNASPIPTITVNSGSICSGNSFTMSPSGAASYTYQGGNAVVSPTSNTNYTVVGTNTAGCISNVVTSSVTVNALPLPTISVNSGTSCAGANFTLVPSGANTYTFQGGSAVVSPTANASYTVVGTNSAGCVSATFATANITVTAGPSVSVAGNQTICVGETTTLTANGGDSYLWFNTGSSSSTIAVSPTVTTGYTVQGTSSVTGCSSTFVSNVTVNLCTGLSNLTNELKGLQVYPNPAVNTVIVELNNGKEKNIMLSDLSGRVISEKTTTDNKVSVDLNKLSNGLYLIKVQSGNAVETIKLIKE
ncbi:MAG: T9SS type A sorting domain-containing protein [Sphingobacteriaceae bacterium]|nr:T9SS type A sorting domain-containing protein [Sphingobacteriaceae bacterium]